MLPPEPTSLVVHANGLDHHVLVWRPAAAVSGASKGTVVLVHGFMDAAGTWDRVAPSLAAAGFRVLAPDMRGFGKGPRVPPGAYYHFVDYVADLAGLTPKEPFSLVGHSMGGTIATYFTGASPERVKSLAVLEGLGPPDNGVAAGPARMRRWIDDLEAMSTRREKTFSRSEALDRLAGNHPHVPRAVLVDRIPHLVEDAGEDRVRWRFDPLHRTTSPMPFLASLHREFLKSITCPVLFVSGGPSGFHPPDEDERLSSIPNLQRLVLENAGHMMHWTEPQALSDALISFL